MIRHGEEGQRGSLRLIALDDGRTLAFERDRYFILAYPCVIAFVVTRSLHVLNERRTLSLIGEQEHESRRLAFRRVGGYR